MTSSRKRRGKVGETLGRQNTGTVATGVIKSAKRSNVRHHKTTGMVFHLASTAFFKTIFSLN